MPSSLVGSKPNSSAGSDSGLSSPNLSPSGRPKRSSKIPEHAQPFFNDLAAKNKARVERNELKKRKLEANSRPNAQTPTPVVELPSKRRKGNSASETISNSILNHRVQDLDTDDDKVKWYRAAIRKYSGKDYDLRGLGLPQLIEMYEDPGVGEEDELVDETDDEMQVRSIEEEPSSNRPPLAKALSKDARGLERLQRVDSSDSTTILSGVKPNNKRGRDEAGKRLPLTPEGEVILDRSKDKGKNVELPRSSPSVSQPSAAAPLTPTPKPKLKGSSTKPADPNTTKKSSPPTPAAATRPGNVNDSSRTSGPQERRKDANPPSRFQNNIPPKPPVNVSSTKTSRSVTSSSSRKRKSTRDAQESSQRKAAKTTVRTQPSNSQARKAAQARRDNASDGDDDDDDKDDGESDENGSGGDSDDGEDLTQQQRAQLRRSGKLKWLVRAVADHVEILAFKENPYADIDVKLDEPDRDGNRRELGTYAQIWASEAWKRIWKAKKKNMPVPEFKEAHLKWIVARFTGWRHHGKVVAQPHISTVYGLDRNNPPEVNKKKVKEMGKDGMLSPSLKPNNHLVFRHEILQHTIRDGWFLKPGKSIGYKRAAHFRPMPYGIMALMATILHYHVGLFKTGTASNKNLQAKDQLPWFKMYMRILHDVGNHLGQDFVNYRTQLFDNCHGNSYIHTAPVITMPTCVYPADTNVVYVSKVRLYSADEADSNDESGLNQEDSDEAQARPWSVSSSPPPVDQVIPKATPVQPVAGPSGTRHSSWSPPPAELSAVVANLNHSTGPDAATQKSQGSGGRSRSSSFKVRVVPRKQTPVGHGGQSDGERVTEELVFTDPLDE